MNLPYAYTAGADFCATLAPRREYARTEEDQGHFVVKTCLRYQCVCRAITTQWPEARRATPPGLPRDGHNATKQPRTRVASAVLRKFRPDMPDATKNVVGWIDGVNRGRLHGWAFHRLHPFRRLTIEIFTAVGSSFVILADRYRADLQQSGIGDGYCGFSVPVQRFPEHGPLRIATQAPYFELGVVNPGQRRVAGIARASIFRRAWHGLQIDRPLGGTHITGWAIAPAGTTRRTLRLRSGDNVLGQQRATLYRSEIAVGNCDGYHGFSFPLPVGLTRPLAIEDVGSGSVLVISS